MSKIIVSTSRLCLSRQQEEFLSLYRSESAKKAFFESYGVAKKDFLSSGYGENSNKPIVPAPDFPSPYDKLVQYLGFTGTQYIGLGVHGSLNIGYDIRFSLNSQSANSFVFGCRTSRQVDACFTTVSSSYIITIFGSDDFQELQGSRPDLSSIVRVINNRFERIYYADDVEFAKNTNIVSKDFITPHQLYIGRRDPADDTGSVNQNFIGRFYSVKILDVGKIIMDLVPAVREGKGCMYDKISSQLFYNIGEGDFIIGPDL